MIILLSSPNFLRISESKPLQVLVPSEVTSRSLTSTKCRSLVMTGNMTEGSVPCKLASGPTGPLSQHGEDLASQETQSVDSPPLLTDSEEEEEDDGVWGQLYPHCGSLPRWVISKPGRGGYLLCYFIT